jgi:CHAD domain-containing protein
MKLKSAMPSHVKPETFTVNPEESVRSWVHRTVAGLLGQGLPHAGSAEADPVEVAHMIRVTAKQLRAILRLLRPSLSSKAFERTDARLKAAAGWLAEGRDRAVAQETLTHLIDETDRRGRRESLACLRTQLEGHAISFPKEDQNLAMENAARELQHSGSSIKRLRLAHVEWDEVLAGAAQVYRRARRRMKEALKGQSDDAFHRWRIPSKQLYYQLQWLEPFWPKRFSKMTRALRRLEKKLGSDHDLAVLEEAVLTPEGFVGEGPARELRRATGGMSRQLRGRCVSLGGNLFRDKSKGFEKRCRQQRKLGAKA